MSTVRDLVLFSFFSFFPSFPFTCHFSLAFSFLSYFSPSFCLPTLFPSYFFYPSSLLSLFPPSLHTIRHIFLERIIMFSRLYGDYTFIYSNLNLCADQLSALSGGEKSRHSELFLAGLILFLWAL